MKLHGNMLTTLQTRKILNEKQLNSLHMISLSVSLLLLASEVRIPIGVVPITLQTFVVFLLGLQLDKHSAINTGILFVAIKLMTLPFWGCPSFGYIIGMGISLPVMSCMQQITYSQAINCLVGYFVTNIFGCLWLRHFVPDWYSVWLHGISPFISVEIFKMCGAIFFAKSVKQIFQD